MHKHFFGQLKRNRWYVCRWYNNNNNHHHHHHHHHHHTNEDTILRPRFFLTKQQQEAPTYEYGKETSGDSFFIYETVRLRLMELISPFAITFALISMKWFKSRSLHRKVLHVWIQLLIAKSDYTYEKQFLYFQTHIVHVKTNFVHVKRHHSVSTTVILSFNILISYVSCTMFYTILFLPTVVHCTVFVAHIFLPAPTPFGMD